MPLGAIAQSLMKAHPPDRLTTERFTVGFIILFGISESPHLTGCFLRRNAEFRASVVKGPSCAQMVPRLRPDQRWRLGFPMLAQPLFFQNQRNRAIVLNRHLHQRAKAPRLHAQPTLAQLFDKLVIQCLCQWRSCGLIK